jgi:PRTRC genetic system protein B
MLVDLMIKLGKAVPVEILPARVLVRTPEVIVWWMPASERTMFFSDRGGDNALEDLNAKNYPHPALVFKACGTHLWVRALAENKRPIAQTRVHVAPYCNCHDDGSVCTGSMKIPREKSVESISSWERSFFQSEFTHAIGSRKQAEFPGGLLAMWKALAGRKRFPCRYLVKANQTLGAFVTSNDDHPRNRPPTD